MKSFTHHRTLAEINVIPLCDILLVLLIIFMVTAPLLQQGLEVNVPRADAGEIKQTKEDVILTIQPNGRLYLGSDKTVLTKEFLTYKLQQLFKQREERDLYIKADAAIPYGEVVDIMAIAKSAGIDRIGMVTQPKTTPAKSH